MSVKAARDPRRLDGVVLRRLASSGCVGAHDTVRALLPIASAPERLCEPAHIPARNKAVFDRCKFQPEGGRSV
jgi:hypothetical protein